jgi:hypothetical protein
MIAADPPDERVIYRERFQGEQFDFRDKSLSVRAAISWLNEEPDEYGSLWEFAEIVPAVSGSTGGIKDFLGISARSLSEKSLFNWGRF